MNLRGDQSLSRKSALSRAVGVVMSIGLLGASCGGDVTEPVAEAAEQETAAPPVETGSPRLTRVSPAAAAVLADDPEVVVIDVRTPSEYDEGHLDGAALIDFYEDGFADRLAELDPDARYLVYCRSGNRSGQALQIMEGLGFQDVADLDGGVIAWEGAGLELTR